MGLLKKMIEKIGIVDEEYDDEEVDQQSESFAQPVAVQGEKESNIPPEFLQHLQRKEVYPRVVEQPKIVDQDRVPEQPKKTGILGGSKKEVEALSPVDALAKAMHVVIKNPENFNDSEAIAALIRDEQSVVINFEHTDPVVAKRITDFVCGVVYAVGGSVKTISRYSLFCAPKSVDVRNERESANKNQAGK